MLEEKYIIKAQRELNETEETKNNALAQLRLWISRHDFFKNCRQDDKFLLQFLRTKKYNMERVIDLFERYLLLKNTYPKWFDYGQTEEDRMWQLYDSGFVYPLIERDEEGRRVIMIQAQKLDPKVFTFADILRLVTLIAQTLLEEEETQISGVVVILDYSNITLAHLRLFPLSDVVSFVEIIRTSSIGRQKMMYMVSMPNFATMLVEVAKKVLSEKLRKRIKLLKSMDELQNEFDMTLLPLEFGGKIPESVMLDEFKKLANERSTYIKEIVDGVDWDKVALEVDDGSCTIT
ncbi:retinaldehyde-binding protein 1-like [Chironomus tepperi]|uniref:retinaldehyde-binding protein 1-like n=1 Tax=Chironomus tepperi TaxID=113505 RepID=UPI00391FC58C